MPTITENILEETCLSWLAELGWGIVHGPDIAPETPASEREDYRQVILWGRLRETLLKINHGIPASALDEVVRRIESIGGPDALVNNRAFHRLLTEGVDVELPHCSADATNAIGGTRYRKIWLMDAAHPHNNDWLALNQYTVAENQRNRRADVVLFVNGLPLALLELKNPGDENATIKHAYNQLQTYKRDVTSLFVTNALLVISDGIQARCGTISSGWDRFMPWRTVDGKTVASKGLPELETTVRGLFRRDVFLDYILNYMVFEDDGAKIIKKAAAYHQYWAVDKALTSTLSACGLAGDRRIGVIWHTQGSGKSLSMAFYAGKVIRHPVMNNPTLVIITDRNDLDEQLFGTFTGCRELLRQAPVQASSRSHLRELLQVASGGVVFSTIQKFMPDQKGDVQGRTPDDIETAIRQLVSRSITSNEVVDIFTAAGLDKPDISILSDEFLEEVKHLPQRNLALELLKKLLNDEIKSRSRKNVVLARSFAEMLEESVRKYQNRAIETAEIIQELIRLAKDLREAGKRGEKMGLNDDEVAFYDALADNGSAVKIMGDDQLKVLAMELVLRVRQSITIDWTLRENARATIRVLVKRILRQFGYPPDMEQKAIKLILEQAEVICADWTKTA